MYRMNGLVHNLNQVSPRILNLVLLIMVVFVSLTVTDSVLADTDDHLKNTGNKQIEKLSDPTKPAKFSRAKVTSKALKPAKEYKLSYIMNSGGVARAMINNQKVREGDSVDGARVRKILSNSVSLLVNGREKILYVNRVLGIKRN